MNMPSQSMLISDQIRYMIENGVFLPGERLPSERKLCEYFKVQRLTLRCGLQILLQEGLIRKVSRQGFYVSEKRLAISAYVLVSTTEKYEGSNNTIETLSVSTKEVNKSQSAWMHLIVGTPIYEIKRLCMNNDLPIGIERDYLEVNRYPDFDKKYIPGASIYKTLEKHYGTKIKTSSQYIVPDKADKETALLLNIEKGEMIVIRRGSEMNQKKEVVYYSEVLLNYKKVEFEDNGEKSKD